MTPSPKHRSSVEDPHPIGCFHHAVSGPESLVHDRPSRADDGAGDLGPLPKILLTGLRHRHVQRSPERGGERLDHAALLLEGVARWQMKIPGGDGDDHGSRKLGAWSQELAGLGSSLLAPSCFTGCRRQRPLDLLHAERLDAIARLEIVEVLDPDATLESFADFTHVILEALEAGQGPGIHRSAVPNHPSLGGTLDRAASDGAAGDGADLADLEQL